VLLCLPAVLLPLWILRRLLPLPRAAAHPDELLDQGRSYARALRAESELKDLGALVGADDGGSRFAPRKLIKLATILNSLTARVVPDRARYPLLVAFTPVYLKTVWLATVLAAWSLLLALVVLIVSLLALLLGSAPAG